MEPSVLQMLSEGKHNACLKELGRRDEFLLIKSLAQYLAQRRYLLSGNQCQLLLFPASNAVLGTRSLEVLSRGCPDNPAVSPASGGWRAETRVGRTPGTLPSETRLRTHKVFGPSGDSFGQEVAISRCLQAGGSRLTCEA